VAGGNHRRRHHLCHGPHRRCHQQISVRPRSGSRAHALTRTDRDDIQIRVTDPEPDHFYERIAEPEPEPNGFHWRIAERQTEPFAAN
jgi:hypothetical protein